MNNYREPHVEYLRQYESIDVPERILSLLNPVIGGDTTFRIVPDSSDEAFPSTLLKIDYQNKLLTLEKIKHTFGHLMVIDANLLTVHSTHDGVEVTFSTRLSRYSEKNGGFYEIRFPNLVKYCQRRMSHRVHIGLSMDIKATFINPTGEKIEGYLRDISADGMRLQLSKVNPDVLKEKSLIRNCVVQLPNQEQINCTLQIRHKHNHIRNKGCTIGGSFFDMSAEQKRDIQKFIAGLERRMLREIRI